MISLILMMKLWKPIFLVSIGLLESRLKSNETYANYISRQKSLWQMPDSLDEIKLGRRIKEIEVDERLDFFNK
jgi:hypothetical protein